MMTQISNNIIDGALSNLRQILLGGGFYIFKFQQTPETPYTFIHGLRMNEIFDQFPDIDTDRINSCFVTNQIRRQQEVTAAAESGSPMAPDYGVPTVVAFQAAEGTIGTETRLNENIYINNSDQTILGIPSGYPLNWNQELTSLNNCPNPPEGSPSGTPAINAGEECPSGCALSCVSKVCLNNKCLSVEDRDTLWQGSHMRGANHSRGFIDPGSMCRNTGNCQPGYYCAAPPTQLNGNKRDPRPGELSNSIKPSSINGKLFERLIHFLLQSAS